MKVYTKTGDKGTTALLGGTRVAKHHLRIECYGTVDELNSFIGAACDGIQDLKSELDFLREIQDRLFTLGAELATDPSKTKVKKPDLHKTDVKALEDEMDRMELELPPLTNFILPGGHPAASMLHVSRCVCRRAERLVSSLKEIEEVDDLVLIYLNRLSDYLFVAARYVCLKKGASEILWKPRT